MTPNDCASSRHEACRPGFLHWSRSRPCAWEQPEGMARGTKGADSAFLKAVVLLGALSSGLLAANPFPGGQSTPHLALLSGAAKSHIELHL